VAESVSTAWASKCTVHQYDIVLPPSALAASQASRRAFTRLGELMGVDRDVSIRSEDDDVVEEQPRPASGANDFTSVFPFCNRQGRLDAITTTENPPNTAMETSEATCSIDGPIRLT